MNKLIIDNNIKKEQIVIDSDTDIEINFRDSSLPLTIDIMPNLCVRIFEISNHTANSITYHIASSCNVIVNKLAIDCSDQIKIHLDSENSKIAFYSSIINFQNNSYCQDVYHNSPNIESKLVNHGINMKNNELRFIVNGTIRNSGKNTSLKQDNKIINIEEGKSFILPNLIVDNNDIEASHSAYIGTFDEKVIFYLLSRGIPFQEAYNMLLKAFLINNMDLEDQQKEKLGAIIEEIKI